LRFPLAPKSITLDDVELRLFSEFRVILHIWEATSKRIEIDPTISDRIVVHYSAMLCTNYVDIAQGWLKL